MRQLLMAAVALSLAGSALAQTSTPAYQNNQSEAQRKAGSSQGNAELFFMVEQLQKDVRRLQGELEEQKHSLDRLTQQSKERYIDLDQRLLDLSKRTAPAASDTAAGGQPDSAPQDATASAQEVHEYRAPTDKESEQYQKIIKLIREDKNYDAAIDALYQFISDHPEGDLTVNAYYWLGEVYLVKPQLEQAKQAFTIVATRYADHRKASDALYKLGVTYDRMGEKDEAAKRMKSVISSYPGTKAASLAQDYLNSHKS